MTLLHSCLRMLACAPLLLPLLSSGAAPAHEIVAYYPGWKSAAFPVTRQNINPHHVSVIQYAFADICWDGRHGNPDPAAGGVKPCLDEKGRPASPANGTLLLAAPQADAANLQALAALKKENPALRVLLSAGGWDWSNRFSDMAHTPATRRAFIASSLAMLRRFQLDGLDIDWEHPTAVGVPCSAGHVCNRPADKQNYIALARELRSAFDLAGKADGKHYLITIAAGAHSGFVKDRDGADSTKWIVELARSLDWINLMTYDYHGVWDKNNGAVAPLYADPADPAAATGFDADTTVSRFLAAGVAPAKLVLGMPFYGYGWSACAAGPRGDGLYQACGGAAAGNADTPTFSYAHLVEQGYLVPGVDGQPERGGNGFTRHWNSAAKVPYLYNPASQVFISYDDTQSLREKNRYIKAKGLRGGMFWELSGDDAGHRLGQALAADLLAPEERR
ncbi:glycoside hydrolase family 18 protein [Janthinobacterium agaricidamnosum]|nr:glycoside hydrolase family 18 protein [Janthinobacterium agaricidamnosum]